MTTEKRLDEIERDRVIVLSIPPCRKCGEKANYITSTQGRTRYVKCKACGHNDKLIAYTLG